VTIERLAIVVAVGPLDRAKSRMGPTLDEVERRALVLAMLDDVLRAIRQTHEGSLIVVTPDDDVRPLTKRHQAELLRDHGDGTNAAIVTAIDSATVQSSDAVLVLQADLPQLRSTHVDDIKSALTDMHSPGVLLVPNDDGGTSALALLPPNAMPTAFGTESGSAHHRSARESGIPLHELPIAALSSDVDTIEDLKRIGQIAGPSTTTLLEQLGMVTR